MTIPAVVFIFLIVALIASVPRWPYSRRLGYYPSSGVGVLLAIFLILLLAGRL